MYANTTKQHNANKTSLQQKQQTQNTKNNNGSTYQEFRENYFYLRLNQGTTK